MNLEAIEGYEPKHRTWRVIVETPADSAAKYRYDPDLRTMEVAHFLPEGFAFPYSFGFIPSTKGDDGDPLDVLLLADTGIFPGCAVWCRLVGVIEGKQKERGKSERNDRLIGVAVESRRYGMIKDLDDLGPKQIEDIGHFFEGYNRVLGRTFRLIGTAGAKKAVRLARDGMTGRKKSKPSR